jgi:hypothetical protein
MKSADFIAIARRFGFRLLLAEKSGQGGLRRVRYGIERERERRMFDVLLELRIYDLRDYTIEV